MPFERISRTVLYAAAHYRDQPSLDRLAAVAGMSPAHFQRSFQRLVGVSPKSFVQHLTERAAAADLRAGKSVLGSALDAGLSGPGRLHDLIVQVEGATPGMVAAQGAGLVLVTGLLPTAFGPLFAAVAPRGLAYAAFAPQGVTRAAADLRRLWPHARLRPDRQAVARALDPFWSGQGRIRCWVPGTPFQIQVWRALARIGTGQVVSYRGLGRYAGTTGARAIGSAVAANPVALAIPCHRVIQASGAVGEYHWGADRKRALLAWEGAGCEPRPRQVRSRPSPPA